MKSLAEWNIGLAVVAEPYRVMYGSGRIGDREERVAVISARVYGRTSLCPLKRSGVT